MIVRMNLLMTDENTDEFHTIRDGFIAMLI
jgi:hypothetical protein